MRKSFQENRVHSETLLWKIALVVKSLDPDRGGHENYINRLLRGLLAGGCEVWCFAESFGSRSVEHANLNKIKVRPLKLTPSARLVWFNYRAQKLIRKHPVNFDFVFTTGNVSFGDVYRAGGGVHATYMDNCLRPSARFRLKHLTARRLQENLFKKNTPQLLITNSSMVKQDIQNRYQVPEERLRVVRNGIDLSRFNPNVASKMRDTIRRQHGFSTDDFVCIFTAGGGGRKGLQELLESFAGIHNKRIKLLVVGRTDASKLRKSLENLDLLDRVVYAGFQPKIEHYYGASDCLVFPSKYDAAANVVCEALACGVAVITTATNGSAELIKDGRNGYVIPTAHDYDLIRDRIQDLAACPNFQEIRNHAISTGQEFSMERHIQQIEAAVNDFLDRRENAPNS